MYREESEEKVGELNVGDFRREGGHWLKSEFPPGSSRSGSLAFFPGDSFICSLFLFHSPPVRAGVVSPRGLSFYRLDSYLITLNMSFWTEACLNLRHAVPKSLPTHRLCRAQSKRFLNSCTSVSRTIASSQSLVARKSSLPVQAQQSWRSGVNAGRRGFSATAGVQHGHITPPKPGEE